MLNSEFDELKDWMFGSLNNLLSGIESNPNYEIIKMTVGEPTLGPPNFIRKELEKSFSDWGKYPPTEAIPILKKSIMGYLERRFKYSNNIVDENKNMLPVPGTREPLHLVGLIAKNKSLKKGIGIVTNPFYHAWRLGAIQSSSKIYWINANKINNYNPDLKTIPKDILQSTSIMYLCFPSNPQGAITNTDYLMNAITLARKYDFILVIDECYIDIIRLNKPKPLGALDVLVKMKSNLDNIIIVNSLSKRSSVPGLRAGFIVGDKKIIDIYKLLVSNGASPVPVPIQKVAATLYSDEEHNLFACEHYDRNFEIAEKFLNKFYPNFKIPSAGFYLWLPVKDDIKTTQALWKEFSLRVMPGTFMGKEINGINPGKGYLRLALVDSQNIVLEAMKRLTDYLKKTNYE